MRHMSDVKKKVFFKQSGGASWWRVGYQQCLPSLVLAEQGVLFSEMHKFN